MDIFREETEFTDIRAVQRVVDLFEGRPSFQRIVRLGLIAGMEYDDEQDVTDEDDYGTDDWVHAHNRFHGYPRFSGSRTRSSSSVYQLPQHYYTTSCEIPHPPSVTIRTRENNFERRLLEAKKVEEKAERKRLKKQKQKERRQLERLKEEQNTIKKEEGKDDAKQSKAGESKQDNDESKNDTISSLKLASAKDTDSTDSSEEESSDEDSKTTNDSGDSEQLDMTSAFVSKAALIARRKLEQKTRPEKREKKKIPVKEEPKTLPTKPNEDPEVEKKDSAAPSSPTFEDNVKISTDLAIIGNRFASAGDFNMAVKYFTDAIKYNPTEYKLFGNRSFCFEKLQEYEKALLDAELSLSMWPGWVKGLFRRGRALAGLKRYEEAAQAFKEVLKRDSSYAEAAQELMRVQITQLMEYGFTREQSSNALIIHGTLKKALEVLSKLNCPPGVNNNGALQPAQLANVTGVSPVLSANTVTAPPHPHDAPKTFQKKPLAPNISNVQCQPKPVPVPNQAMKTNNQASQPPQELFPVWVGNLVHPVTESMITNVFKKVGVVYSVKLLISKRCAFVNFTKQEFCDEAIRRLHGSELNGMKIAVRYPDRIPQGMGISKAALKAEDMQDENMRQNESGDGRNSAGNRRPFRPYKQVPDYRGNHSN